MTDCFITLSKLDFRLRFIKWFMMFRINKEDREKLMEMAYIVDSLQRQIFNITDFIAGDDHELKVLLRTIGMKKDAGQM